MTDALDTFIGIGGKEMSVFGIFNERAQAVPVQNWDTFARDSTVSKAERKKILRKTRTQKIYLWCISSQAGEGATGKNAFAGGDVESRRRRALFDGTGTRNYGTRIRH
jgi:hypothetical protein